MNLVLHVLSRNPDVFFCGLGLAGYEYYMHVAMCGPNNRHFWQEEVTEVGSKILLEGQ